MRRPTLALIVILLGLTAMLGACAKRPVGTQVSAPPPTASVGVPSTALAPPGTGSPSSSASRPGAGSGSSSLAPAASAGPTGPGTRTAPSPREFAENTNLKDVYFDFDKYVIRADSARNLEANATWLKSNPSIDVLIEGHCDERGTNEYNLVLGERRARSAMNYLVSQGIQASRMTIISYGEERPVCRESSESCWSRNRRAHFLTRGR